MQARCRDAQALGIATLAGWRFVINREGYGSIAPRPGGRVLGVLWRLSARDLAAINAYESVVDRLLSASPACGADGSTASDGTRLHHAPGRRGEAAAELYRLGRPGRARLGPAGALYPLVGALVAVGMARRAGARIPGKSVERDPELIRHVVIRGRVQGVGYRAWTEYTAIDHGLDGWVRNRRDGSVEAVFAGTSDAVADMIEACRRGPPAPASMRSKRGMGRVMNWRCAAGSNLRFCRRRD